MDKVSVIIPCYNQAQFLPEALDSVLAQTYSNWEAIIVDDGSVDDTKNVSLEYVQKDERIKYVYRQNGGLAAARNTGILNSVGEFILPLDSDDIIKDSYLEKAVLEFINNPQLKVVNCKAEKFGIETGEWLLPDFKLETLLKYNIIFCTAMFKMKDFKKLENGYDENMRQGFEDWDLWVRMIDSDKQVFRLDDVLFRYRIRNNSMVRSISDDYVSFVKKKLFIENYDKYAKCFGDPFKLIEDLEKLKFELLKSKTEINSLKSSRLFKIRNFFK